MNILTNLISRNDDADIGTQATQLQHVLSVISSTRRREVIAIIHDRRSINFSEVVDTVAAAESDGSAITPEERNRVYTSLYQTHIPTLAQHGIVDYHPSAKEVKATQKLDDIHAILRVVASEVRDRGFQMKS